MNIRLSGFSHEVEKMLAILKMSPEISVVRESKDYAARSGNDYIYRYITIEWRGDDSNG